MNTIKFLHSNWAYLTFIILIVAICNAWIGIIKKKEFSAKDLRISLFGLILSHIQLLLGLILYFVSPYFKVWSSGASVVMKDATYRLYLIEHPFANLVALFLITVGWSLHKRQETSRKKFLRIGVFYLLGLLLLLSRIPWSTWLS